MMAVVEVAEVCTRLSREGSAREPLYGAFRCVSETLCYATRP